MLDGKDHRKINLSSLSIRYVPRLVRNVNRLSQVKDCIFHVQYRRKTNMKSFTLLDDTKQSKGLVEKSSHHLL